MNILAVDTTGGVCSVALSCEGQLTCELYLHDKLTHSQKLMPLVDDCLAFAGREIADVDAFAVVAGPGSFTGVRIGVCAVKALAQVCKKMTIAVDTLESLAWNIPHFSGKVCPLLDARRGQVYAAIFENGRRMMQDTALPLEELLAGLTGKALFLGDGAAAYREEILRCKPDALFAPTHLMLQRAGSACMLAEQAAARGELLAPEQLLPNYLRDSQAQQNAVRKRRGEVHA